MTDGGYKVCPKEGGPFVIVPSLEEAARLLRLLSNGHGSEARNLFSLEVEDTEAARIANFFLSINENAQTLLFALSRHKSGVRGDQLAEETGFSSDKFGGIFGGASKIAKKFGLKFEKLVFSEMRHKGTERFRFLQPGKLLAEHADKLNEAIKNDAILLK